LLHVWSRQIYPSLILARGRFTQSRSSIPCRRRDRTIKWTCTDQPWIVRPRLDPCDRTTEYSFVRSTGVYESYTTPHESYKPPRESYKPQRESYRSPYGLYDHHHIRARHDKIPCPPPSGSYELSAIRTITSTFLRDTTIPPYPTPERSYNGGTLVRSRVHSYDWHHMIRTNSHAVVRL